MLPCLRTVNESSAPNVLKGLCSAWFARPSNSLQRRRVSEHHWCATGTSEELTDLLFEDDSPYQGTELQDASGAVWPWTPLHAEAASHQDNAITHAAAASEGSDQPQHASALLNQLPSSWHAFLHGPAKREQTEQRSNAESTPTSGSAEPGPPRELSKQEAKQQRIREKNRRAMQKFRTRQRVFSP